MSDAVVNKTRTEHPQREQWRLTQHAGYFVSDQGRVKGRQGRILKERVAAHGYRRISPGLGRDAYVHVLVLEAFVGPRPEGHEADHINMNRADNRVSNLRWVTIAENRARRRTYGEHNGNAKLKSADVLAIRASADANTELACRFGVTERHIRKVKGGSRWTTL